MNKKDKNIRDGYESIDIPYKYYQTVLLKPIEPNFLSLCLITTYS